MDGRKMMSSTPVLALIVLTFYDVTVFFCGRGIEKNSDIQKVRRTLF